MIYMSLMKKMLWSKLRLPFGTGGRNEKGKVVDSLRGKPNVNEEYKKAFRTKSYIEMCNKVQGQVETRTSSDEEQSFSSSSSSSSSIHLPRTQDVHLSEYLLEPRQETLTSIIESSNLQQYLLNYFEVSLEACKICESLLTNVHQVRINYHSINNVIKSIKRVPDSVDWTYNHYNETFRKLVDYVMRKNPFSTMNPQKFKELHNNQVSLLHKLTSQCTKTKRRTKFLKFIKRIMATFLVVGCGTLAIVLLVFAIHSLVGMVGAPALIVCILAIFMVKKIKRAKNLPSKTCGQLDIAARGVYILINDFDTMSRIVQRLNDEMEHRQFVADICVKKGKNNQVLKEVVNEFQMHDSCFIEQLEELENQIYLCFLDINRSRKLVVQELDKC